MDKNLLKRAIGLLGSDLGEFKAEVARAAEEYNRDNGLCSYLDIAAAIYRAAADSTVSAKPVQVQDRKIIMPKVQIDESAVSRQPEKKAKARPVNNNANDKVNVKIADSGYIRFFVGVGIRDEITTDKIIDIISNLIVIDRELIKNVKVLDSYSFVEIPQDYESVMIAQNGTKNGGKKLMIEVASGKPKGATKRRIQKIRAKKPNENKVGGEAL